MISTALALYAGPGRPRRSLGAELLGYGAAISGVVIAVRIAWVFGTTAVIRARGRSTRRRDGVPGRDLILFITFCVIMATLVLQGLTMPV